MQTPEGNFTLFPRLPTELRLMIWRECLPHRVVEFDNAVDEIVFNLPVGAPSPCKLRGTTYFNGLPPVIARVCRESCAVALDTGSFPVFSEDRPLEARWSSDTMVNSWYDPMRDLEHLNWTHGYKGWFASDGNPLYSLAWHAERQNRRGSMMIGYLDFSPSRPPPDIEVIYLLPSWMVVMHVVVVHADFRTGAKTGLFGLLGDACVQIVDVFDEGRVNALFDLAKECERGRHVTVGQDFSRHSAESMKRKLRSVIIKSFGSEELLPILRPAIMFRLCTDMCNHLGARKGRPTTTAQRGRGRGRG